MAAEVWDGCGWAMAGELNEWGWMAVGGLGVRRERMVVVAEYDGDGHAGRRGLPRAGGGEAAKNGRQIF